MFRFFNTALTAITVYSATSTAALAQSAWDGRGGRLFGWLFSNWSRHSHGSGPSRRAVPEIDAASGLLAIAAICAALALAYELKRRRSN